MKDIENKVSILSTWNVKEDIQVYDNILSDPTGALTPEAYQAISELWDQLKSLENMVMH